MTRSLMGEDAHAHDQRPDPRPATNTSSTHVLMTPVEGSTVREIVSTLVTWAVDGLGYFCQIPTVTLDHSWLGEVEGIEDARESKAGSRARAAAADRRQQGGRAGPGDNRIRTARGGEMDRTWRQPECRPEDVRRGKTQAGCRRASGTHGKVNACEKNWTMVGVSLCLGACEGVREKEEGGEREEGRREGRKERGWMRLAGNRRVARRRKVRATEWKVRPKEGARHQASVFSFSSPIDHHHPAQIRSDVDVLST